MTEAASDGDHPVFLAVNLECAADFRRYRKRVTPQSHLLDEGAGSVGSGFAPDNPGPGHDPKHYARAAPRLTKTRGAPGEAVGALLLDVQARSPDRPAAMFPPSRQRLAAERVPKKPAQRKRKPEPLPALVREPDYGDAEILTPAQIAELFAVTPRTVRRWTDAGLLPSFRTVGGHRRFRWEEIRRVVA